ncbi:MAG TPA: glycosyltransferase [Pyrinomonadaceae bacterium]|nr:glycosyltransferase [Pyrinomonadaceae bacterium]
MSVLIVTPDDYGAIRKTVRHLAAQTARDRLELVIVAPSRERLGAADSELREFHSHRVVEVGEVVLMARAKMAGLRATSAPVVAFAEDHCFPSPTWAEALIERHAGEWAAVGPAMRNANPATMTSWAGIFLHYGCCMEPASAGRAEHLPWHNIAYKRDLLLARGEELRHLLAVEGVLLDELRARGHALYFETRAHTYHVQITRLRSWVSHSFWGGRLFGAVRARRQRWTVWRRLLYVGGGPLIPLVKLRRTLPKIRRAGLARRLLPRVLPAMVAGLVPHAIGEMVGYALGLGDAERRYSYFEMRRTRHVTETDRRHIEAVDFFDADGGREVDG